MTVSYEWECEGTASKEQQQYETERVRITNRRDLVQMIKENKRKKIEKEEKKRKEKEEKKHVRTKDLRTLDKSGGRANYECPRRGITKEKEI